MEKEQFTSYSRAEQGPEQESREWQVPDAVEIRPELFVKFQSLIFQETGKWWNESKAGLLCVRLSRRLRVLKLKDFDEYYNFVSQPQHDEERRLMLEAIQTADTNFFRDPKHFEFLAQRLFPRWQEEAMAQQRARRIRIWSAGCASGEEPYSLAMVLLRHFPPALGWEMEILASDVSSRMLERAQNGVWPATRAEEIPVDFLRSFMLKGTGEQEGFIKAGPEIRSLVSFSRLDLKEVPYSLAGTFDLIFCRNVLIYFDNETKRKIVNGLLRHLSPQGFLFVGQSESLNGVTTRLRSLAPSIYGEVGENGRFLYDFRQMDLRNY